MQQAFRDVRHGFFVPDGIRLVLRKSVLGCARQGNSGGLSGGFRLLSPDKRFWTIGWYRGILFVVKRREAGV
ncbi:hypothetical protein [Paenibacillus silviterrae]|uniref:hypothetical protein n=1 Tax=Paenibacillus silviterrae TaxID=3242194 RepID=UPI002543693F|nr:hypothetical protein [Paenibacillus chinjuensis]